MNVRHTSQYYLVPGIKVYNYSEYELMRDVADFFGVTTEELKSDSRKKNIVKARYVTMYLIHTVFKRRTLDWIGGCLGGFNHATVIHAIKSVSGYIETYPDYDKEVSEIMKIVNGKILKASQGDK